MNREQEQQVISLRSEIAHLEERFTYWWAEATKPRFSRRYRGLNEQTARHKAARLGDRILELKAQIKAIEGEQSEAA